MSPRPLRRGRVRRLRSEGSRGSALEDQTPLRLSHDSSPEAHPSSRTATIGAIIEEMAPLRPTPKCRCGVPLQPVLPDSPIGTSVAASEWRGGRVAKRSTTKRELVDTGRNKGFAKRTAKGRFKEIDDVGRSLTTDRRRTAKTAVKSGHGDQGDRPGAVVKKR